jgi:predicted XRE-type DNA-binding protein
MTKWPKRKDIEEVLKDLEKESGSRALSLDATPVEKTKHDICAEFVKYMLKNKLTQRQLARQLELDEAIVSKIVHYRFDDFTIDRLYGYLSILNPDLKLSLIKKKRGKAA